MNALQVYALLNKKIKGLVSGIQSASINGTTITFVMNDGSTQTMTFPTPEDGVSITDVEVNSDNELICTLSNGSQISAGIINVISPTAKVEKVDKKTTITITDTNGTTTADVLDGSVYPTSGVKPTNIGAIGDIVFNSLPQPGGYIGWVYTPLGWFEFGQIKSDDNEAFILSDGSQFILSDGNALYVRKE